jgi:diguanylate cyclase (GGDEF)-like protein
MNMEVNFLNDRAEKESKEQKRINKKREGVEKLRETDNPYEDSVKEVAKAEGVFREQLKTAGVIDKEAVEKLADSFSDEVVSKKEIGKEVWEDKMTGLRNKNAYNEEIPQMMEMGKRQEQDSSFLMIDFDHFKKVNDVYGHGAGDMALRQISKVIKDTVRSSDIVYRYGGEEFVVYLPDTDSVNAMVLGERIRDAVESADIEVKDNDGKDVVLKKTVSIGCAGTDMIDDWKELEGDTFLEKVNQSIDTALYASKTNGRNQVTMFTQDLIEKNKNI